jgi:DNA invertase Pin-like site-specific DNA recombinase
VKIGYGRVSTLDQNPELQTDALIEAGCDPAHLYIEKISSGKKVRPKLVEALKYAREGDTVIVWKLDRAGRDTKELLTMADELYERGIALQILTELLAGTYVPNGTGKLLFTVLAAFAEYERSMNRERTMAGLAAARARGRVGGAKAKLSPAQATEVRRMHAEGRPVREILALFPAISRPTLYRYLGAESA